MPKDEKGLNRGGIGGQEGELGEDSKNMDVKRSAGGQQDKAGQQPQRPGQQPDRPGQPQQPPQQRGGLKREPNLEGAEKDTGHEVE